MSCSKPGSSLRPIVYSFPSGNTEPLVRLIKTDRLSALTIILRSDEQKIRPQFKKDRTAWSNAPYSQTAHGWDICRPGLQRDFPGHNVTRSDHAPLTERCICVCMSPCCYDPQSCCGTISQKPYIISLELGNGEKKPKLINQDWNENFQTRKDPEYQW